MILSKIFVEAVPVGEGSYNSRDPRLGYRKPAHLMVGYIDFTE